MKKFQRNTFFIFSTAVVYTFILDFFKSVSKISSIGQYIKPQHNGYILDPVTEQEIVKAMRCVFALNNEGFKITKKGEEYGACWHTHVRFGTYIVWPENISLPDKALTENKEQLNATNIAKKYNLSARKINMMFSEIGWIQRYLKGWNITELGIKNGGIQKESPRSGVPFVEWPETIFDSPAFIQLF